MIHMYGVLISATQKHFNITLPKGIRKDLSNIEIVVIHGLISSINLEFFVLTARSCFFFL